MRACASARLGGLSVRALSVLLLVISLAGVLTTAPSVPNAGGGGFGVPGLSRSSSISRGKAMGGGGGAVPMMAMASAAMAPMPAASPPMAMFDTGVAEDSVGGAAVGRSFVFNGGGGEAQPPLVQREVLIREAHVSAELLDVGAGAAAIAALAAGSGGSIDSSSVNHAPRAADGEWQQPSNAHVSARVPAAALDAFLADLRALLGGSSGAGSEAPAALAGARLLSESVSVRDAGGEHVDAAARERGEELALKQMEALLAAAGSVQDVLAVRREMQGIASRLEAARAQRAGLEGRAALSSVSVSLSSPNWVPPPPPPPAGWSAGAAAGRALATLLHAAQFAAEVAIFASIFALPLLAAALLALPAARAAWAHLPATWRTRAGGTIAVAAETAADDDA